MRPRSQLYSGANRNPLTLDCGGGMVICVKQHNEVQLSTICQASKCGPSNSNVRLSKTTAEFQPVTPEEAEGPMRKTLSWTLCVFIQNSQCGSTNFNGEGCQEPVAPRAMSPAPLQLSPNWKHYHLDPTNLCGVLNVPGKDFLICIFQNTLIETLNFKTFVTLCLY